MMYEKCTLGYLTKRKKAEILWIVFFVVLGVAIFLTGYLWEWCACKYFYCNGSVTRASGGETSGCADCDVS